MSWTFSGYKENNRAIVYVETIVAVHVSFSLAI